MMQTILIVEDNPVTRKMLRLTLENERYVIWEVGDGQSALRLAQEQRPAVIVQDLMLPDMDGFDLIRRLRALPMTTGIPILCYSSLVGPDDEQRVLAAGFTDLILKPAAPAELLKIVRTYLERQPAGVPGQFTGRHILLVDDDLVLRKLSTLRLQAAGARVTAAVNGNDALAKARAEAPDAILSDVLMPECDGFGLCLALRQDPHLSAIPIVLMSSKYVDPEDLELAKKLGANTLIMRSPDLGTVLDALTDSLTEFAPPAPASTPQLQAAHLERVMYQLHRNVNEQAQSIQNHTLYGILAGFLEQVASIQARGGELAAKLDEVLVHYLDACGYPTGAIYLLEANAELAPHALCGVPKAKAEAWLDFFGQAALLSQAMEHNIPIALSTDDAAARAVLHMAGAESMVLCPLYVDNLPLGVLVLCSKRRQLDPEWLALAQAATRPISQTIVFARTLSALTVSEQRFRGVAESLTDCVVITNEQGKIVYANAAVEALFGYTADSLRGLDSARLTPLLAPRGGTWTGRATHSDGRQIPVKGTTAVMLDPEQPDHLTYTHVIHDLSAQEHMERLRHLANHDALTQVYNHRIFEEALKTCLSEAALHGAYGALLFLDLDHFKQINDRLGHAAGDTVLVAFAEVLRSVVRQTDVVARLGGDEFAIVAPYTQSEQAQAFAIKLLQQLAAHPVDYNDASIPLHASIGIAFYDQRTTATAVLLASADQALYYRAKEAGRGCYRVCDPDTMVMGAAVKQTERYHGQAKD